MSDSFFTSRNQLDEQMSDMPSLVAEQFIEASVRRMVRLEGPLETAKRLQRLCDICSGVYVLPIEHWKNLGARPEPEPAEEPAEPASEKRRWVWWMLVRDNPVAVFWIGFFLGVSWAGLWW